MKRSPVLFGFLFATILAFFSWGAVLFFVNPENATLFEWVLFLVSLFLVLTLLSSLFLLLVGRVCFGRERAVSRLGTGVREGGFLAVFLIGLLFLYRAKWLVWWVALFLFAFLFLIELFFLRKFRKKKETNA